MVTKTLFLLVPLLLSQSLYAQETKMVEVQVDGESVRLHMRIYKPKKGVSFPTLVLNHGSTGKGRHSELFSISHDFPALANYFVQHGWAVVMPARRGRGGSEGKYDEGFSENRSQGYSCEPSLSIPGADRALRDISAAMEVILKMPFVDDSNILIGGISRGGILSIAYAGMHPTQVKGVINFVGGWLGTGCYSAEEVNSSLFKRGAKFPKDTIWLYGNQDQYYPISHSRKNFNAFKKAGGKGKFFEFEPFPKTSGHDIFAYSSIWTKTLDSYLESIELSVE